MGILGNTLEYDSILNDRISIASVLMMLTSGLTLIAASAGVFHSTIYIDLIAEGRASNFAVAGAVNQDILSIPVALLLFALSAMVLRKRNYKLLIVALGLVAYILYGYAVYTFGMMVTPLYLAYIAIFALSVYSIIIGLLSFDSRKVAERLRLGRPIRVLIGVFFVLMTSVLSSKWISDILLNSFRQTQPELYIIAAMDLGVALPAIGVAAAMILAGQPYGVLLSGIALIKILTLCISVALGTFIAPHYGLPADYGTLAFFALLAVISLILKAIYIQGLSLDRSE